MFSSNNVVKTYSRRSPSSAPGTRSSTSSSSSYHASPTRGISINSNQGMKIEIPFTFSKCICYF